MFNLQPKRLIKLQPHAKTRSRGVSRCGMNITSKRLSAPRRIVPVGTGLLLDIIRELGLTANLNFVLDVADKRSYDGTSQTWTDATGQGNSFFLGATSGVEASDPTFTGTAGKADEGTYFSFDGGDYFTESAAHTFMDNWHKDNGAFTVLMVCRLASGESNLFANTNVASPDGIWLLISSSVPVIVHAIDNLTKENVLGTTTITVDQWSMIGFAFNEPGLTSTMKLNTTVETVAVSASVSTDPNTNVTRICAQGDASSPLAAGSRLACMAAWSTHIGAPALNNIYSRLKSRRFTSMP